VHETRCGEGFEGRRSARFNDVDVLSGHSHIPWDTTDRRSCCRADGD
jgi:hypothetical protein